MKAGLGLLLELLQRDISGELTQVEQLQAEQLVKCKKSVELACWISKQSTSVRRRDAQWIGQIRRCATTHSPGADFRLLYAMLLLRGKSS